MNSGIGVSILALFLVQNVQIVLSSPLPENICAHSLRIETGMTCEAIALKCQISMDALFVNNGYFKDGETCSGPLSVDVDVCCHFGNGNSTIPRFICPVDECPGVVAEVCGSDHVTYISNCHLEREACRFPEKKLHAKEIGKCPEVDPREEHRRAAIDGDETCDKEDPEDCAVAVTEREALQLFRPTSFRPSPPRPFCNSRFGRPCLGPYLYLGRWRNGCLRTRRSGFMCPTQVRNGAGRAWAQCGWGCPMSN